MGKVLKAIAVIAIVAAVAYFAPMLTPHFLAAAIGTTAATAAVTAALSIGLSMAFQAFSSAPADAPSGERRPTMRFDPAKLRMVEEAPSTPEPATLDPIEPRSWRWAFFWPRQRYSVIRVAGDCMVGMVPENTRWAVVSRHDRIRPGDLFCFDLDDLWRSYGPVVRWRWFWRLTAVGMVKRYLGTEREWGRLIFDCTNPPVECETGFNHVRFAYRVLSWHPSWWAARRSSHRG